MLAGEKKQAIIEKHARHTGDTGSPEVQVALFTARIEELNQHFETHKHDYASRHGLLKMVGRRRRLLEYLKKIDSMRYQNLIKELGLRK